MTPAESAIVHILERVREDARLAYYIGPGTESLERLITANAEFFNLDREEFKKEVLANLKCEAPPEPGQLDNPGNEVEEWIKHAGTGIRDEIQRVKNQLYAAAGDEKPLLQARIDGLEFALLYVGDEA